MSQNLNKLIQKIKQQNPNIFIPDDVFICMKRNANLNAGGWYQAICSYKHPNWMMGWFEPLYKVLKYSNYNLTTNRMTGWYDLELND